jgi:hypothetical protein
MATFVNFLRLTELATGEGSGTWGTTTNTNLELIGEALGYGTEQSFSSDADATTTIGDGVSDPARAMYFKITSAGSLTATRTLTIAPNTVSRVMFIENATTGSQSIAISQGSGANVTIATGKTAVVYLDGAGATAAVVDAMSGVDPGVTDTLTEVLVAGNTSGGTNIELSTTDKVQFRDAAIYLNSSVDGQLDIVADTEIQIAATTVDLNGDLDVSGTTLVTGVLTTTAATVFNGGFASNADSTLGTDKKVQFRDAAIYINSSVDGQLDIVADTEIQIAATTIDINGAINASGEIIAASLDISGNIDVDGTTNLDVVDIDGAVDMASTLAVGGVVTANAGVVVDNFTLDGTTLALSSGSMTLDSASQIILKAAGGNFQFLKSGTEFARIFESSSDFYIYNPISDKDIKFYGNDGGSEFTALTLDMSDAGTASFNHDIKVGSGGIVMSDTFNNQANNANVIYRSGSTTVVGNNATALVVADSGTTSFGGVVTANAGVVVDNFTLDGTTLALSSGDMTLDVAGDISLDSDSGYVLFKDAGTEHARIFQNNSGDVNISSQISDKDMKFLGNDGGVGFTALTLDMSEAGTATFNHDIKTAGDGNVLTFSSPTGGGGGTNTINFKHDGNTLAAAQIVATYTSDYRATLDFKINKVQSDSTPTSALLINQGGNATFSGTVNSGESNVVGIGGTPADVNATEVGPGYINLSRDDVASRKMIQFGSNGTLLGSIFSGHNGSQVGIGVSTTGITFNPSTRSMMPADPTSVTPQLDATLDIGFSSVRWKDLYLSGGVYLGGTAAANKLDSYEEGTWTPVLASDAIAGGYTTQVGKYTKIGNVVNVSFNVQMSSIGSFAGAVVTVTGLPFTAANNACEEIGTVNVKSPASALAGVSYLRVLNNGTEARLEQNSGTTTADHNCNANKIDTGTLLQGSITYLTA